MMYDCEPEMITDQFAFVQLICRKICRGTLPDFNLQADRCLLQAVEHRDRTARYQFPPTPLPSSAPILSAFGPSLSSTRRSVALRRGAVFHAFWFIKGCGLVAGVGQNS